MIEYIVGMDFGHGETAAWGVPVTSANPSHLSMDGLALKLRESNDLEAKKLPSVVYYNSNGEYSLNPKSGYYGMAQQMKGRISGMSATTRTHYQAYIRLIVERLLECNRDFLSIEDGEPNFVLCLASPTRWNEDEKREYLAFFNEAIAPTGLHFEWIINESDAAYFTHSGHCSPSECVLVMDYGSSTIDYTAMKGGKKISEDSWSNQQLGASAIEKAMFETLDIPESSSREEMLAYTRSLLSQKGLNLMDPLHHLIFKLRKVKEEGYTEMTYDYYEEISFKKLTGDPAFVKPRYVFEGNLLTTIGEYRESVKEDLVNLRESVRAVNNGKDPDRIILSGGASIMRWFKDLAREIFSCDQVVDNDPAFVVAHGVALYAQAQMKALAELKEKLNTQDYASIYISSDKQATAKGISNYGYIPVNKITSDAPVSGNTIRKIFCDFIKGLDSSNTSYCALVQDAFDINLTNMVKGTLYSVISNIFHVSPELGDVKVHIPVNVIDWESGCFEPGGAWYDYFTKTIDASSSRFIFTWDKLRNKDEAKSIAEKVNNRLGEFSKNINITYPDEMVKTFVDEIRDSTVEIGEQLFYSQQLFKTTFVDPS